MMIKIQARTSRSILTNWLSIRLETLAIFSAQHTTELFQVPLPSQACSENQSLHRGVSKKLSYAIGVRTHLALSHDGSRCQRIEVHRLIRKSQCLVNFRWEVEGVWEPHMLTRLSKCIQCTIMQRHLWWLENFEGYRFTGMHWLAIGSVWLANLFLEQHKCNSNRMSKAQQQLTT